MPNNSNEVENSCKSVLKSDIYAKYKPRPIREIRSVVLEMIDEHNNLEKTTLKLSRLSHSIPYWMYKKVVVFFENN